MALSEASKVSIAFKKLIAMDHRYASNAWYEETAGGGLNVHADDVFAETVPSTPPGATTSVVKVYTDAADGALKLTEDISVPSERGWAACSTPGDLDTRLRQWVPPKFAQGYTVKLYEDNGAGTAKGDQIFTTDAMDWFFDYETGFLAIQDTHSYTTPFWIEAYRYVGETVSDTLLTHASRHENGGDDEISVAGLSGTLADAQNADQILGIDVDDTDIADGKVLQYNSTSGNLEYETPAGGSGEANTASNLGVGHDIFYQKDGVDLEFRGIVITASTGLQGSQDTTSIHIAGVDATDSGTKGVASFNSGHFSVTAGAVSLNASLTDLTDITTAGYTDGFVLQSAGAAYYGAQLDHTKLGSIGSHTHAEITSHINSTANPHATDIANVGQGTLAELNTRVTDATLDDSSDSRTPSAHTIVSHSDTTATGTELETLTDGSDADSLHSHTKLKTWGKIFYIEDPVALDEFPLAAIPKASTVTRVTHITDAGTVDFNIEKRAEATPLSAGTNIWTVDKQADTSSTAETSFDSASITARDSLWCAVSAVASSPTQMVLYVEGTIT